MTSEGIIIFESNFLLSTENSYFCSGLALNHLTVFLLRIDLTESFLSNLGKLSNETVINNGLWSKEMYSCEPQSIYQPQSVTAKILIIERHIKLRDDCIV